MKGRWRKQQQEREWMTRVDNSILYQMEKETVDLQACADESSDQRLKHIAQRFNYLLAVATGKTSQFDLAAVQMPEDAIAKIPDPRGEYQSQGNGRKTQQKPNMKADFLSGLRIDSPSK